MQSNKLNVLKQIVEKGFGEADMEVIDELIHDDWKENQKNLEGGKEVLKKAIRSIAAAFSNRKYSLLNYSVTGDMVWVHYKFTGIHSGSFMGHNATNKNIAMDVMDIARIKDGKLVEHWGIPDRFALLMQLGFLPQPDHRNLVPPSIEINN